MDKNNQINKTNRINLIVATDINGGIAKYDENLGHCIIPWNIQEDYNYFLDVTKWNVKQYKNVVIMGKNTWIDIIRKQSPQKCGLNGRINIIVSSTLSEVISENEIYISNSLASAILLANEKTKGDIFICGGAKIYEEALKTLPLEYVYVSRIQSDYNCNIFFPMLAESYVLQRSQTFSVKDKIIKENVDIIFNIYGPMLDFINLNESAYLNLLNEIIKLGNVKKGRNGITYSSFGKSLEFDLQKGFPLLTTKKVFFRGIFEELIFFLKGNTNTNHLVDIGVNIWKDNTSRTFLDSRGLKYEIGDMGPMYGFNLRHYGAEYTGMATDYTGMGFDQLQYCMDLLKTDPFSRRIMMTTFNPTIADKGVLHPCHGIMIMFNVSILEEKFLLSCHMSQRSADTICGIPFNIASYALLLHLLCETLNTDVNYQGKRFAPGLLIMALGDVHVYDEHYTQCIRQILRVPTVFPKLIFNRQVKEITDFKFTDVELRDYNCYPGIIAKMVA